MATLKCTLCEKLSHKSCVDKNAEMSEFVCSHCQLTQMDPYFRPVATLIHPFIVHKYCDDAENVNRPHFGEQSRKVFQINSVFRQFLTDQNVLDKGKSIYKLSIQLRCIALNNGDGIFNNNFPTFGHFRLNQSERTHKKYLINPPPNDHKRRDRVLDLTKEIG